MEKDRLLLFGMGICLVFTGVFLASGVGFAQAWDSGCTSQGPYSATTGKLCNAGGPYDYTYNNPNFQNYPGYTTTYAFYRELAQGSRGEDVAMLQQLLTERGYSVGVIDGIYGRATRRAVLNYQFDVDLNPTGVADMQTLSTLSSFNSYPPIPCPMTGGMSLYPCQPVFGSPTISSVGGPQTLSVNQLGTWTVVASDAVYGGNLTYSVDWGDVFNYPTGVYSPYALYSIPQQSATFTHSYSQPGTYKPTFTVTNNYGQSVKSSLTVVVGGTTSSNYTPAISFITPTSGPIGTQVTIYGSRLSGVTLKFGGYYLPVSPTLSSSDSQITFFIPASLTNCTFTGTLCTQQYVPVTPGSYNLYVSNAYGTSNTLNFTVTGQSTVAPSISSISPSSATRGSNVTLYGNVDSGVSLYFGGYLIPSSFSGSGQLNFTVPYVLGCSNNTEQACFYVNPGTSYAIYVTKNSQSSNMVNFYVYPY